MNNAVRYISKPCKCCQTRTSVLAADDIFGYVKVACRGCGAKVKAMKVYGAVVETVKCSSKCEGSHGHVCDCSCGGKNHGRAYGAVA